MAGGRGSPSSGAETPRVDMELVERRLKIAEADYRQRRKQEDGQ